MLNSQPLFWFRVAIGSVFAVALNAAFVARLAPQGYEVHGQKLLLGLFVHGLLVFALTTSMFLLIERGLNPYSFRRAIATFVVGIVLLAVLPIVLIIFGQSVRLAPMDNDMKRSILYVIAYEWNGVPTLIGLLIGSTVRFAALILRRGTQST